MWDERTRPTTVRGPRTDRLIHSVSEPEMKSEPRVSPRKMRYVTKFQLNAVMYLILQVASLTVYFNGIKTKANKTAWQLSTHHLYCPVLSKLEQTSCYLSGWEILNCEL